jgi:PAS domain-containing protein
MRRDVHKIHVPMDTGTTQVWEHAAAIRLDAAGRWQDASDEALELLGVPSVDALRGLPPDAFTPEPVDPVEQAAFADAYASSLAQGMLIESPFRRLDGELVRARAAVLPDDEGGYRLLFYPVERPTTNRSTRVFTIADVLAEWRGAERRLVALDPDSAEARRVAGEIELLRVAHGRLFRRAHDHGGAA